MGMGQVPKILEKIPDDPQKIGAGRNTDIKNFIQKMSI
jgi:hypothetical protein